MALIECGTRAVIYAAFDAVARLGEHALARRPLAAPDPTMPAADRQPPLRTGRCTDRPIEPNRPDPSYSYLREEFRAWGMGLRGANATLTHDAEIIRASRRRLT